MYTFFVSAVAALVRAVAAGQGHEAGVAAEGRAVAARAEVPADQNLGSSNSFPSSVSKRF